ncbi:glycosyltransferase family 2 protein [Paenibacillus sp. CAA11]|uniref:glycosyltransferase family 2 protein n=1 Tax=Paenibacillus sp. CAA11 TaxID=1532905 RepID=UPI000D3C9A84|nr:glycosyltransferase family 2 protein [Paenibacillus sp. CAA11]AWB45816.1 glycosyltransferase family 2 protein [Paenibacillus sp. CAA11]
MAKATKREASYEAGFRAGYERGQQAGRTDFYFPFEGTSIIIPTYNQKEMVLSCLESIEAHTRLPYEIIVVDDASTDGTLQALSSRKIRVAVHARNAGFAASVNTGLMMAKGSTVVLLNNDILVTPRWLDNMLHCLHSGTDIGAVGPVTNYIGGEQQIDVPYREVRDMWTFAAAYNAGDPGKWRETDRLVGFCLLMDRKFAEQTGYLDEGFRTGNFEDDDWGLRVRVQGRRLMIAGDAFIHHFGSVTMKSLAAAQFQQINEDNRSYFAQKWGEPAKLLQKLGVNLNSPCPPRPYQDFYPTHVLLKSSSGCLYWLEDGRRYRVSDIPPKAKQAGKAVRVSQRDLSKMPLQGEKSWRQLPFMKERQEASGLDELQEGDVIALSQEEVCQVYGGQLRPFVTPWAAMAWGFQAKEVQNPKVLTAYSHGLPLLAPNRILAEDL